MGGLGDAIGEAIVVMVILAFVLGGAFFALLFFGVPWLWELIKPWLHMVTA